MFLRTVSAIAMNGKKSSVANYSHPAVLQVLISADKEVTVVRQRSNRVDPMRWVVMPARLFSKTLVRYNAAP